ncbi:hypothetical protein ACLB2K_074295 [Fragaria x ananassa]
MHQLRPISLCNVLYKIGSKVLANRLKPVMGKIISPFQGAFVPGRLISDISLLAFEIAHCMKRRSGKKGVCALKLDMGKAYDRVEWFFLETIMRKLGFCDLWVRQILRCVTTVSYSFLLNGTPRGLLYPGRGLRQGDALSPYLFLFCGEAFSRLICREEERGRLRGVELCRGAPSISHLFFADDSFIFCRAETMDCVSLQGVLKAFEMVSGKAGGFDWVQRVDKHDKYLGVPVEVSYSKEEVQELECLLCGVELETGAHFFKECTVVKEFWRNGPLKEVIPSVPNSSLKEWVWTVMDALDKDQQSLFFSSMWALWTERNKVHGRVEVKRKRGQMKWECHPSGRLKINVDGAFNGSVGSG